MNTFKCVDSLDNSPEDVFVIRWPDFMEEIKSCERFKGSFSKTTVNYLRSIASEFGNKYDKNFNPYRNIVPTDFQGIPFSSDEKVSSIISTMFSTSYPQIFKSYLETKIRNRPFNLDNVIIVGFDYNMVREIMKKFDFNEAVDVVDVPVETTIELPYTPIEDSEELLTELLNSTETDDVITDVKAKKANKKKKIHS